MWRRKTYLDLATELGQSSYNFTSAYLDTTEPREQRHEHLVLASEWGIEVLRALTLAIRSEQDAQLLDRLDEDVGCEKRSVTEAYVSNFISSYRGPYRDLHFPLLRIREACNKIAHTDPRQTGFWVSETDHELALGGRQGQTRWVAAVSVLRIAEVVKTLGERELPPDVRR